MTAQASPKSIRDVSDDVLRAIEELKSGTGFGSVEIIIHEGRVTQIEKREKIRFSLDKAKSSPTAPSLPTALAAAK